MRTSSRPLGRLGENGVDRLRSGVGQGPQTVSPYLQTCIFIRSKSTAEGACVILPGWYQDPANDRSERWWDGQNWTGTVRNLDAFPPPTPPQPPLATQPAAATPPPPLPAVGTPTGLPNQQPTPVPTSPTTVDNRFLWGIIAAPVAAGAVEMLTGYNEALSWLLTAFVVLANGSLAYADQLRNPRLAHERKLGGLMAAAVFLMPLYIFWRQKVLGEPQVFTGIYVVAFVGIIALQVVSGTVNYIDGTLVEESIEDWARDVLLTNVRVECPQAEPSRPGHRFLCELSEGGEIYFVRVEVLNRDGDIEWEIR